ncbi:MAG: peptidase [Bacteroidetes bacterium]|nr:MAG: peptidase [Bacteroidota bacterium]
MIYTLIFLGIIAILIYIRFFSSKKEVQPFPSHWHELLLKNVMYYQNLEATKQVEFQNRMMVFLSEINIDGIGVRVEELDELLIAASAVIPVFGFKEWHYPHLNTVMLYPNTFNQDFAYDKNAESRQVMGMVGSGIMEGQMILSRNALRQGFKNATDKNNTAIHEFVHLLDKADGEIDGIPPAILDHQYTVPWLKMVHDKMEMINADKSDIRNYGGTSQIEFFAVASEYFFERPDLLKRKHPELFTMLEQCFQQSPKYSAKYKK